MKDGLLGRDYNIGSSHQGFGRCEDIRGNCIVYDSSKGSTVKWVSIKSVNFRNKLFVRLDSQKREQMNFKVSTQLNSGEE